ncbi:MAG: PEP-CTERM sorting domain-containing protein [Deltaproteobacteria bacterium]|nr:PEP-CTERM sorting domain-containing protein [Deltaproteobacteria bacterium]
MVLVLQNLKMEGKVQNQTSVKFPHPSSVLHTFLLVRSEAVIMKRMSVLAVILAGLLHLSSASSVFAMTMVRYEAERAQVNPQYSHTPGGFTFTFGQGGQAETFVFAQDFAGCTSGGPNCAPGYLTQLDALGTATLKGDAWSQTSADRGFHIDIELSGLANIGGVGSPKKELVDTAYSNLGGPIDPNKWGYYTSAFGTLAGFGTYAGYVVSISNFGPPFQIGDGANGKNISFGGSGWFEVKSSNVPHLTAGSLGDGNITLTNRVVINIDDPLIVPEPSTILLLSSALIGMMWYRHKV